MFLQRTVSAELNAAKCMTTRHICAVSLILHLQLASHNIPAKIIQLL